MAFDPMTGKPIEDNEEMAFDPMTGEPIKKAEPTPEPEKVQETGGFDPMTEKAPEQSSDKPESKPVSLQKTGGFDPMTGKPIGQPTPPPVQPTGGFDPMTGKPIGQPTPPPVQPTGGFDPMTGKPIGQPTPPPIQPTGGFDPMTGKPIQNAPNNQNKKEKKSKTPVIIGCVLAAVAVAAVLVVIAISSGLFLGKSGKVMLAAANTFKDKPHFVEAIEDTFSILGQSKYTLGLSGDVDGTKFDGELRNGGKEKQLYVQLSQSGDKVEVTAGIDAKNAKFQVPQLSNYVFVYDYNKTSTGYLADELGDDSIEQLNMTLSSLVEQTDTKDIYVDLLKICKDELKSIKFTNVEKEEFTIDDKDVNCSGYKAVITGSNVEHVIDDLEKLVNNKYASLFETALVSEGGITSPEDWKEISGEAFDEMRDAVEDMDDIELTFYLYKNKLAGIVLGISGDEAELCFEGGDYRIQNMTLKLGGVRYRLSGSDEDSEERFTLEQRNGSYKQQIGSLRYDYKSGKYSISLDDVSVSGKLTSSGSEVNLKVDEVSSYYSMSPDLNITLKKGAKMDKLDGKEFDLGKADEDDYMDLIEDVQDKMYDKDLDWIMYLF